MSHLLLKAIAEHKNEAVRAESKARVLQVLQGTRIDVVIELLEELLEHLRAIVKEEEEEAPEDEESEDEEPEDEEDDGDEGEEDSEQARSENPSEGSQGLRARPSGRSGDPSAARSVETPSEARENREPSKASQVRAALAGGPLPRDRVVMQLAALPPGADATAREHRRTIQAWRQMLSNLQRQGDLEVLAGDAIGLTTAGKERVVMEQQLSAFRESLSAPAPTPEPAPTRALEEPRRAEDQPETGEEEDERLARLRRGPEQDEDHPKHHDESEISHPGSPLFSPRHHAGHKNTSTGAGAA